MRAEIPTWIIDDLYRRQRERPFDTGIPLYIPTYDIPGRPPAEEPEEEGGGLPEDDAEDKYVIRFR